MYSALHIPSFPLAVLLRDDPSFLTTPTALLDTSRSSGSRSTPHLLAVNRIASRSGVAPGMTTTRALVRCRHLQFLTPDPVLEDENQRRLRNFADALTPDFEESAPGTFLLDLLTLPHAQQAPHDWIEQTLRKATSLRLPLQLALAPTPDLALLSSHHPSTASHLSFSPDPELTVRDRGLGRGDFSVLFTLPLTDSQSQIPNLELLALWGIETLGDLAVLPRQGLAERLGPGAARLHDIIHGKHHRLLTLHRPPQHFQVTRELEHPLDSLEPLLFLLRRNLDTLCARLDAAQRAAQSLHLSLTFDDGDLHLRELRIPDPTRDPSTLLRLLHTHLDTVKAPAPVTAFHLKLLPTLPAESQHLLFERSLRDPNKFADTLARLEALLGPKRIGIPIPLDSHKPDSFQMSDVAGLKVGSQRSQVNNRGPSSLAFPTFDGRRPSTALPLKRYRPAIEVHVASEARGPHHHPLALLDGPHPGPITATRGPFPLSGHWWDPTERWQRTEWDIQLPDHTLLRLVHLPSQEWLLEGMY